MNELPTIIALTTDKFDFNQVVESITLPSSGACAIFTGMVRAVTEKENLKTDYLEYEAYEEMAIAKMEQIAAEIRDKWPSILGITIMHRVGKFFPGDPTVLIGCSAAHRDTGVFDAARYGIERLKQIVAIWKKEVGPEGEFWPDGDYRPQPGD
jgi:molybdopterin synthase catalytic subunit